MPNANASRPVHKHAPQQARRAAQREYQAAERICLTESEAAASIQKNLSPRTMERWRRDGTGPAYVKLGRRVGYTPEALAAWVAKQTRTFTGAGR